MVQCTNRQKHSKPLVYQSLQVYQDCTSSVPTVYQSSKTAKTQSKQHKNDHWCTSRHMSTKTVPIVYQRCTKNSQKTVKTAKMTIGVPIVTGLPRLYQQCNKNLPIVNKNLAIANRASATVSPQQSYAVWQRNIAAARLVLPLSGNAVQQTFHAAAQQFQAGACNTLPAPQPVPRCRLMYQKDCGDDRQQPYDGCEMPTGAVTWMVSVPRSLQQQQELM